MDRELREWLSLAPADLLCYAGYGFLVGLYFAPSGWPDAGLASVAIVLSLIACLVGMKRDERVSDFTNVMKLISYPFNVLFVVLIVASHALLNDGAWRRLWNAINT